MEEQLHNGYMG